MDLKISITTSALIILAVTLVKYRRTIALPFTLALLIAIAWTSFYRYEYIGSNIFLFNQINTYSLVVGTTTLTLLCVIYRHMPKRHNVLLTSVLYLALLGLFEAIAYHLLDIRLNSNFPSLLNLGVIHAPIFMKIFYLSAAPAYIFVLDLIENRR